MQRELDGEAFLNRGLVEAAITNVAAPARRNSTYNRAVEFILQGNALRKGSSYKGLRKSRLSAKDEADIYQAAAAFKLLKKTNFYDIMAATLKAEAQRR